MQHSDFISRSRDAATELIAALDRFKGLTRHYVALDLGNAITEEDFVGANAGVTKAQLIAAIISIDAIEQLLAAGHATNILRITR